MKKSFYVCWIYILIIKYKSLSLYLENLTSCPLVRLQYREA